MKGFGNLARRLWVLVATSVLLLTAIWLPTHETTRRLRVSPGLWPGSEAIVLAYARGELPAEQFQMIELPWSSAAMRALGNGAADVAVVTLDSALRMREAGQELRVLMVLDQSVGADVLLAREGIADVKALQEKRVGVDVRGGGAYLLVNALESAGMSMDDVRLVPLIQSEMEQAVADGAVDAVVAAEPWSSRLRRSGFRGLYDSKQLLVPMLRVLVASEHACVEFQPQLAALLKAQIEGTQEVRGGKVFAGSDIVLRREKIDQESFVTALPLWKPFDGRGSLALLAGNPSRLGEMAEKMTGQMLRAGLLKTTPAERTWIDTTFLRRVVR